jgi:CHASE2 domain-containing sensor protein
MNALDILRTNRARAIIAETVLALFLFFADPLGVVAYKARAIDDSIGVLTQFTRNSETRKELAVVLIDQDALDAWRADWPLTYERTAGLIHALACAKAVGVFFDFTLSEKFNLAQGKSELEAAVLDPSKGACADGNPPAAISVFFGKADNISSPLAQSLDRDGRAFSIGDDADDSVYPAGSVEFPDSPVPIAQATPAFGVIRSLPQLWPQKEGEAETPCNVSDPRPKCWMKPLAIEWSGTVDPKQGAVSDTVCRGFPGWADIIAGLFGITKEGRFEPCPPILTLKAQDLFRDRNYIADHGNPADLLQGRFVFVGTELAGLNDEVFSPVHGYLPGVYKHAVATDNLLSSMKDMSDYPTVPRPWLLGAMVVVTYLLIEAIREFSLRMARRALILWLAALIVLSTWGAIIHFWKWPWSLMVTVFGYYAGGVALLAVARFLSPATEAEPRAPVDAKP